MSASTSPQPHFVLALESVICWTLHGWLCKPGGALLLHKAETKDDRTPIGSSVVVENMRARLSLVTCWYCELAALLTARLTLFIKLNNFTHRFCWVSSLFQRDICFLIDSATLGDKENVKYYCTDFLLDVVRTYYVYVLM